MLQTSWLDNGISGSTRDLLKYYVSNSCSFSAKVYMSLQNLFKFKSEYDIESIIH